MKATHLYRETPICHVRVRFRVEPFTIEQAIIWIWTNGKKATKKEIADTIDNMFYFGGQDSPVNYNHDEEIEEYSAKAKEHAKKLYPTFYKTTQS